MLLYIPQLFLLAWLTVSTTAQSGPDEEVLADARLDFVGLASKHGYPAEIHKVVTSDGYILTLHRIPYGRKCGANQSGKVPVLLMHGLLLSSISWIITGPERSLAYILADKCYDVWLGNSRGNYESDGHTTLSKLSPIYWDFSWHEMGAYDVPADVDYILSATGQKSLHYIGHSQGTTQFFVFNSLYPQYSNRIRSFQGLAPVAYVANMKSPLVRIAAPFSGLVGGFTNILVPNGLFRVNPISAALGRQTCKDENVIGQTICSNLLFIICGFNPEQINATLLPAILSRAPAGSSSKQLSHFSQNVRSGEFRQYDYSWLLNPIKYGTLNPPSYNLQNILSPVALHYSLNDVFVDEQDLFRLASELPNLIGTFLVPLPSFSHLDYIWGNDVKPLLYDRVLAILESH